MQYLHWLEQAVQGNLGYSLSSQRPVADLIGERLFASLSLMGISLVLAMVIGIAIGAIPIITLLGNSAVFLVEGAFVVETIFSWPGLGRLGVDAILKRDYPLVMGVVILSSVVIIVGNLVADIAYGIANPRLRSKH